MAIRANIRRNFLARMGLLAFAGFFFMAYCIYDGTVAYPRHRIRAEKYIEFQETEAKDWVDQWEAYAKNRGWPLGDPGEPNDEQTQFIMAGISVVVGLIFLALFARNFRRWIEADEEGFTTSWKQKVAFDDVFALEKRQWRDKGIAAIRYMEGDRKRRLVLDDCKYDIDETVQLLREMESRLDDDQILNGRRELSPEELEALAAEEEAAALAAAAEESEAESEETA
jgi:hypothetical protein